MELSWKFLFQLALRFVKVGTEETYKLAEGVLSEFTGISDPYETPVNPDLIINTENRTVDDCVQEILLKLEKLCFFGIEK